MKKFFGLLLVVISLLTMVTACGAPAEEVAVEPEVVEKIVEVEKAPELRDVTIGFSWNRFDAELAVAWQDYMIAYAAEAGPKAGLNINWVFNVADLDVARQTSNIQDLINQGVDLIGARPEDAAAIGASIKAAQDAGIPFVTFDRESSSLKPDAHTGADSYTQALTTGYEFAKILEANNVENPQCIELLGDLKDMNAVNRSKGWADAEIATGAWTTVVQVPTDWLADKFYSGTANALQAYPEANCMFVASDFVFDSVTKALQEAGKLAPAGEPNHMWIADQDMNPPGLVAMEAGYIDVLTTYDAYFHSVAFVDVAIKLLNGEELAVINWLVPGRVATLDNFEDLPYLFARDYR